MMQHLQNTQVLLLAGVLLAACAAKLIVRVPVSSPVPEHVHGVPLPGRLRRATAPRQSRRMTITLGLAEGVLAAALLVTSHIVVKLATTAAFAAATWTVGELRVHRPDAGCGCFGGLSAKRVGRRTILRALLFTAAAAVSLGASHAGVEVLGTASPEVALLFTAELAVFAALSPELSELTRRGRLRRSRPSTPCERRPTPLRETFEILHDSPAWAAAENSITSAVPLDVWREGCWRFIVYQARLNDQDTEIVFAVSTAERDRTVRAALVPSPGSVTTPQKNPASTPKDPAPVSAIL
jgi:hypothetical protein